MTNRILPFLFIFLTGCASISEQNAGYFDAENWKWNHSAETIAEHQKTSGPWIWPWQVAEAAQPEIPKDPIDVHLTVDTLPYAELEAICGEMRGLRGCGSPRRVYLLGDSELVYSMKFKVQYVAYKDMKATCGSNDPCYRDNTLFTYPYDTKGRKSAYYMGIIGDLIGEAMVIDLGFNQRRNLGHELMAHIVEQCKVTGKICDELDHPGN